ncbi:MAG: glycosyltransferase family 4 protein [Clostridia bacterium]|nr:glycosyltransferase family 4 protein [Clostridia bacterium]
MKKVLILSIYPAPYRVELFEELKREFNTNVFFESFGGDFRETEWFSKGNYHLIDTDEGLKTFTSSIKSIKSYSLVAFYDFTTNTSIKLILKCIFKKIPYTVNCDGVMMSPHGNPVSDLIKKFLVSHASACFASGESAKKYFLRYGAKEKNIHIHTFSTLHSCDISERPQTAAEKSALRKKLGLPDDKFISIAVGRFIPLKRYNEFITEWRNMPETHLLLLVGSGPEEEKYRKTISDSHIKNVIIEGFHPKEELFEFYKASDLFVHPTSYDVWGLVVNEALACGLPVVSSDHCVSALELIVDGKNGYKVPMGDDALMCERIRSISADKELYENMGSAAIETIKDYTVENMAEKHACVFKTLLK